MELIELYRRAAGVITALIALVGLGLDSVIELFSAGIVIWQLRAR